MNTKLETGPGVWELRAHNQARSTSYKTTLTTKAIPSPTHMLFVKMQQVSTYMPHTGLFVVYMCAGRNPEVCG